MSEVKKIEQGQGGPNTIWNALTVDVEDYFMVSAFAAGIKFEDWPRYECRVERNTHRILELFAKYGVKGTFFVLGWVAENYPALVKDIQAAGHEIASHGYNHRLIYDLTQHEFRADIRRAKRAVEDITGVPVNGYRATSYSIVKKTFWALDMLVEEGFRYDSSIYPIHHDRYGVPGAQRFVHTIKTGAGDILEIPPTTFKLFGQNIPAAGGGYFRLYPLQVTKAIIRRINEIEKKTAVIYIHPWEIDMDQPKLQGSLFSKFRHYVNLKTTEQKLGECMKEFKFKPISEIFNVPAKTSSPDELPAGLIMDEAARRATGRHE
jgi:polysaccharide deacetylase family protein (PEP-CTERM system associated)